MSVKVNRDHGYTTYYCSVKDCTYYTFEYRNLGKHYKTDHPNTNFIQQKLDSINLFTVIKGGKK
jgi:hypothetical protein